MSCTFNNMRTLLVNYSVLTWVSALTGATLVGLVGVLPLFIVPNEQNKSKYDFDYQIKLIEF